MMTKAIKKDYLKQLHQMITGFQIRAAKGTLGLTAKDIADTISIHPCTIIRLCNTKNMEYLSCNVKNLVLIQNYFNNMSIIFPTKDSISLISDLEPFDSPNKMTAFQLKAARIATNLTQEKLSNLIKISSSTLSILENLNSKEYIESYKINIPILKKFFKHIGIIFPNDLTVTLIKDPFI